MTYYKELGIDAGNDMPPLQIIKPIHIIAGFVKHAIEFEKAIPFFTYELSRIYTFFRIAINENKKAFGNPYSDISEEIRYLFMNVGEECLTLPNTIKISSKGKAHYQAKISLPCLLNEFSDVILKAMAEEYGREFFEEFACDSYGKKGKITNLKQGDLETLF